MKISLNWLKEYIQTNQPDEIIIEILTSIGLEVESVEKIERIKGGLNGLVVAEVLECDKHPDAEKLSLTTVDIGNPEKLSIVCGAPNVAKGQKVIVATVGATLYPVSGEPLTIKKTKIRGAASEGMICAEDEIGLGNSHAGIMILDQNATLGMPAAEYFNSIGGYNGIKIESDTLIEIGLTPNRSDATGHLGVAFDIAAALKINYPGQLAFHKPFAPEFSAALPESEVTVEINDADKCSRYSGICIKGVKIASSPDWLVSRLQTIGLSPINNIVDITNFVLHELGQPLHAFDLNKIAGNKIIVQTLPEGTKFTTLDDVERTLKGSELMICDGFSRPMCIAGVFGGKESGISEETVDVFLESAHFNPKSIRTTSMSMQLRTDAAACFEKGTDVNITVFALQRAANLILEIAGGEITSALTDVYPNPVARKEVKLRFYNVRRLIGKELPEDKIIEILDALDMQVLSKNDLEITVAVPTNKSDVHREVDVIEEILRIYGYNNIESSEMLNSSLSYSGKPDNLKVKNKVSEWLAAMGFSEMMGLSLSKSAYYENLIPVDSSGLVYVNNTSNQQLDILRSNMLPGTLEAIVHNQNRQIGDMAFFEFGKTYLKQENGNYSENQHLTLSLSGQRFTESWLNKQNSKVSFYTLKSFVENILSKLGIRLQSTAFKQNIIEQSEGWAYAVQFRRGKEILLSLGRVHPAILFEMDIKNPVFFADINWDLILQILRKQKTQYKPIPKYPAMRRDLALVVDKELRFEQILTIASKQGKNLLRDINLFDVYEHAEQLGPDKKSYAVSFTFLDETKTLKDQDVDDIMSNLMKSYEKELGALIRR